MVATAEPSGVDVFSLDRVGSLAQGVGAHQTSEPTKSFSSKAKLTQGLWDMMNNTKTMESKPEGFFPCVKFQCGGSCAGTVNKECYSSTVSDAT
jgi:hypothetical protein